MIARNAKCLVKYYFKLAKYSAFDWFISFRVLFIFQFSHIIELSLLQTDEWKIYFPQTWRKNNNNQLTKQNAIVAIVCYSYSGINRKVVVKFYFQIWLFFLQQKLKKQLLNTLQYFFSFFGFGLNNFARVQNFSFCAVFSACWKQTWNRNAFNFAVCIKFAKSFEMFLARAQ